MQNETYTFVFFGIIGSGKGTQIKLLQEYLSKKDGREQVYAYPGGEYRKLIDSGNYTSQLVKDSYNRGELQPDFLTNSIFVNIILASISPDKHILVDGYPRTLAQSAEFEKIMKYYGRKSVKIIYIEISEAEAMKRNLARGRSDDTEEGIKRRFEEYKNNVIPSMKYFDGKPGYEFYKINGEQTIEKVHQDIMSALGFK
jgi:adenylate kinase